MPNRSLLIFCETITLHGFFTPHFGIICRMNVFNHLFEIFVSMGNAANSTCLSGCRIPPKCLFETEYIFNSRKASFVWFPAQHLSAHLGPGAGQREQSFQICLHLHLPFLSLRKATNNTPDPWPHGKEIPLYWLKNPQCELFETIFTVICFLLSLLMNWLVNVFLIWTEIDRSSTWYLRSQTFWRWDKSCLLYRLSKSPLKIFFS